MTETSLLVVCGVAFVAVLLILGLLAGLIRLIMLIFPDRQEPAEAGVDAALLAGIQSAAAAAFPGSVVTRVEEVR